MAATLTQDDIKLLKEVFATKEDLARFATKDDLAAFATKEDLKQLSARIDTKFGQQGQEFDQKLDQQSKGFDGKLEKLSQRFDQKLGQQNKGFDEKLAKLGQTFDQKLEDVKTAILDGVRSYLETTITPLLHDHEKRIHRVETHLDLPPLPVRGQ